MPRPRIAQVNHATRYLCNRKDARIPLLGRIRIVMIRRMTMIDGDDDDDCPNPTPDPEDQPTPEPKPEPERTMREYYLPILIQHVNACDPSGICDYSPVD